MAKVTIGSQYAICEKSFHKFFQNYNDQAIAQRLLDEFGRFRVWAGNVGANRTGRVSLDYRLREASHIYTRLTELLEELNKVLEEVPKLIEAPKLIEVSDSPDTQASFEEEFMAELGPQGAEPSDLEYLVSDITHIISCLYKLFISIQNPAPKECLFKIVLIDVSYFELWDIKHIDDKFCPVNPQNNFRVAKYLSERLGKANTRRRQLLKYYEAHYKKTPRYIDGPPPPGATEKNEFNNAQKPVTSTVEGGSTRVSEKFSVPESEIDEDEHQLSQTSYASSTNHALTIRVPPPPNENAAIGGGPFECPYCFNLIKIRTRQDWKSHVFGDLQPYVCTFPDCPKADELFGSQREWFDHEVQLHRREWYCGACSKAYSQKTLFQEHIKERHSELVTKGHFEVVTSLCERGMVTDIVCPLCGVNLTLQALEKHLGLHLLEVALFVLPHLGEDKSESSSDSKSLKVGFSSEISGEHLSRKSSLDFDSNSNQSVWDQQVLSPIVTGATSPKDKWGTGGGDAANILQWTPLHIAASKGHASIVETLLSEGDSVSLEDISGRTALHYAALGGDIRVVDALLEKHANPAAVDVQGRSSLHIAAAAGNLIIAQKLIESGDGALPMITDKDGRRALDLVIDKVSEILESNSSEHASPDHASQSQGQLFGLYCLTRELLSTEEGRIRGWSPLHSAVHLGEMIPTVEILLKLDRVINSDSNPEEQLLNSQDENGATPLHVAARAHHWELVKFLIENGCDLSCKDVSHEGVLMLAVKHRRSDVVKLLLKKMREHSSDGDGDIVSRERNNMGITSLHWAAAHGIYKLVVKLVRLGGAKPTTSDKLGKTALHYAALMGHTRVAKFLLLQDLNLVDATDMAGDTPLHCAAACGKVEVVKLLFDLFLVRTVRASLYDLYLRDYMMQRNKAGETALHYAARGMVNCQQPHVDQITGEKPNTLCQGSCCQWHDQFMNLLPRKNGDHDDWGLESDAVAVVLLLFEHEVNIKAVNNKLESPLHLAARWGRLAVAEALLNRSQIWKKANVNARDILGDTPLHLAVRWGHEDLVKLLVDKGAIIESENYIGQSPAKVAESHLQFGMVDLLRGLHQEQEERRWKETLRVEKLWVEKFRQLGPWSMPSLPVLFKSDSNATGLAARAPSFRSLRSQIKPTPAIRTDAVNDFRPYLTQKSRTPETKMTSYNQIPDSIYDSLNWVFTDY